MDSAKFGGTSFPKVIASSVIRSAHQGESHGGIYIIDLETGCYEQVIDWNDETISWEGRGSDRGLRGIAFYADQVFLAASDEILVYTKDFELVETYRNKYLKHCHEICISDDVLFLTSTGFDSILEFDLVSKSFIRGYCLRYSAVQRRTMHFRRRLLGRMQRPNPKLRIFDPRADNGPLAGDTIHVNNVHSCDGVQYVAGTKLDSLLYIKSNEVLSYARIPNGAHNARPFREGVLLIDTDADQVAYVDLCGCIVEAFAIPHYDEDELLMSHLPSDHARQAFGRGLAVTEGDLIIGGSSPATISAYRFGRPTPLRIVNITMNVRNSIHGLEIWPP